MLCIWWVLLKHPITHETLPQQRLLESQCASEHRDENLLYELQNKAEEAHKGLTLGASSPTHQLCRALLPPLLIFPSPFKPTPLPPTSQPSKAKLLAPPTQPSSCFQTNSLSSSSKPSLPCSLSRLKIPPLLLLPGDIIVPTLPILSCPAPCQPSVTELCLFRLSSSSCAHLLPILTNLLWPK